MRDLLPTVGLRQADIEGMGSTGSDLKKKKKKKEEEKKKEKKKKKKKKKRRRRKVYKNIKKRYLYLVTKKQTDSQRDMFIRF